MDIEFHYWMTGIIARHAGFDQQETEIIAYSSQFVDDNDVCLEIRDRTSNRVYRNFISQTMNILKPKNELMRIYPIFHFVPGDPMAVSARRRDGKMHLLNTTPDNAVANAILADAFKAEEALRPYRIGIASHTYVDTWAHQNFVGWYDSFNAMGANLSPNIGHADAGHDPDWPGHRWNDLRLVDGDINNNLRFLAAAMRLFEQYRDHHIARGSYTAMDAPTWAPLEAQLRDAMRPATSGHANSGLQTRMARYRALIPELPEFDESTWFDAAIETEVRGLRDSQEGLLARFTIFEDRHYWRRDREAEQSHWFRFQEAVKAQERFALGELAPLFRQLGVDIRTV